MADVTSRNKSPKNGTTQNGVTKDTPEKAKYWDPLTEGVKWIEKYTESLDNIMEKLPEFVSTIIATFAVFTFGATLRGNDSKPMSKILIRLNHKYHF